VTWPSFYYTCSNNLLCACAFECYIILSSSSVSSPPSFYAAAAIALAVSALAATLKSTTSDTQRSDWIAPSWLRVDQISESLGSSAAAPAGVIIVVSVVAVAMSCAWLTLKKIRSARLAKDRLVKCYAWTQEAWNQEGSRHHISALAGGQLSTLVLGADTVDRAEKWRKVFEKVMCDLFEKYGVSFRAQQVFTSISTFRSHASTPRPLTSSFVFFCFFF